MQIAYLIMIHKNFKQFTRLFNAIYDKSNVYAIHIDKKSDKIFHENVRSFLSGYTNVLLMKSQPCIWGGFSMVDIELKAIYELLKLSSEWKFFINLSGQDFPLKTQDQIKEILSAKENSNFITVFDDEFINQWCTPYTLFRPKSKNKNFLNPRARIEYFYFEVPFIPKLVWIPKKRSFLKDTTWYAGWQWFALNRVFCEYLFQSSKLEQYIDFYKKTFIPDESFFQTFIMNSKFKSSVVNDNKRMVSWNSDKGVKIIRESDYDTLIQSTNIFARKFDETVDSKIFDKLEQHLTMS